MIFQKTTELTNYTIFFSQMNEQSLTIKQFDYEIIPMHIHTIFIYSLISIYIITLFDIRNK